MKQKLFPVLCIVLSAALVLSVAGLISTNIKENAAVEQLQILMERVQELEEENTALRLQQNFQNVQWAPIDGADDHHCILMVESWDEKDGVLSVSSFAQAALAPDAVCSAQLELQLGGEVIASQPMELNPGEAAGVFETDITASFQIPQISAGEELQLWLVVESSCCGTLLHCGAGWYPENGQLMIITG